MCKQGMNIGLFIHVGQERHRKISNERYEQVGGLRWIIPTDQERQGETKQ